MTLIIAVCEDYKNDRELLLAYLTRYADENMLALEPPLSFAHTRELINCLDIGNVDAIFLDIFMEDETGSAALGVEAARRLRREGYGGAIVFITSSDGYYPEGFEVDAAHYLIKPVSYESFSVAIERVTRDRKPSVRLIEIPVSRVQRRIPHSAILYAEVYNHQTLLHTTEGVMNPALTLTEVEALLGGEPFLRCFRSYVINMEHVEHMGDDHFLMTNGERVPITKRDAAALKEKYLAFCLARMKGRDK